MTTPFLGPDLARHLDWFEATDAIATGHRRPPAQVKDTVLELGDNSMLTRTAWIDGIGMLVKAATVFPGNRDTGADTVHGAATIFDDVDGSARATVDFALLTEWKTAADSLLAARRLAPSSVDSVVVVGAGPMAKGLTRAYRELYPDAQFSVAARSFESAERFADSVPGVTVARNLAAAVRSADLITVATTATEPIIAGEWLRAGQHLDLVGAFRPAMREADDDVMRRGRLFVDSRATTIEHIGELIDPIRSGALRSEDVIADFYDLDNGRFERTADDEITVFKNGGGAHLDLMVADYIARCASPVLATS